MFVTWSGLEGGVGEHPVVVGRRAGEPPRAVDLAQHPLLVADHLWGGWIWSHDKADIFPRRILLSTFLMDSAHACFSTSGGHLSGSSFVSSVNTAGKGSAEENTSLGVF